MKIVHLMLFNFYYDDTYYQENILPIQNKKDGHEVYIIASSRNLINGKPAYSEPSTYYSKEGIKITRVAYKKIINQKISEKIRAYCGIYQLLEEFKPDIIFSHGIGGYESKTIEKYVKNHPETKLYIDCHSDYLNSATNFFSKYILHGLFYRHYFWKYVNYAEKIYYIAPESLVFLKERYKFEDQNKLEYFPLGGYIPEQKKKEEARKKIRKELNIGEDDILIIHSGKLDKNKKSNELINAFTQINSDKIRLLIVGKFTEDVYDSIKNSLEKDKRIKYLGWKSSVELQEYLMAGDIYIQPGSRTVTVQNAACCGCALILNKSLCYTYLLGEAALYAETSQEIKNLLEGIAQNPLIIAKYKESALNIARNKLDYRILANKYIKNK